VPEDAAAYLERSRPKGRLAPDDASEHERLGPRVPIAFAAIAQDSVQEGEVVILAQPAFQAFQSLHPTARTAMQVFEQAELVTERLYALAPLVEGQRCVIDADGGRGLARLSVFANYTRAHIGEARHASDSLRNPPLRSVQRVSATRV
jgi:hypothetical protein